MKKLFLLIVLVFFLTPTYSYAVSKSKCPYPCEENEFLNINICEIYPFNKSESSELESINLLLLQQAKSQVDYKKIKKLCKTQEVKMVMVCGPNNSSTNYKGDSFCSRYRTSKLQQPYLIVKDEFKSPKYKKTSWELPPWQKNVKLKWDGRIWNDRAYAKKEECLNRSTEKSKQKCLKGVENYVNALTEQYYKNSQGGQQNDNSNQQAQNNQQKGNQDNFNNITQFNNNILFNNKGQFIPMQKRMTNNATQFNNKGKFIPMQKRMLMRPIGQGGSCFRC